MTTPHFKKISFSLAGEELKTVFENLLLDMHPELFDQKVIMEITMDCEKESITITAEPLCKDRHLFLDRQELGKHLDS
jgi:hypothetical protein